MTYLTYVDIAQVIVIHLHVLIIHAYPPGAPRAYTFSAMGGAGLAGGFFGRGVAGNYGYCLNRALLN